MPATLSLPPHTRARPWVTIARKDWRILRRDPQQLVLFGYPLFIVGFNAFQLLSRGRSANPEAAVGTTMGLLIFAALLLVATTAAGAINREGRSLALLALAPVSTARILLAKWLVAAIPPLVIIEASLVGLAIYLRLEIGKAIILALFLALLIVTMCGLALVFNIAWPRLNARSARRQSSGPATILSLLSEAIVGAGGGIILFLAFYLWHGLIAAFALVAVFLLLGLLVLAAALSSPRLLDRLLHNERLLARAQ